MTKKMKDYGFTKKQKEDLAKIVLNAVSYADDKRVANMTSNHHLAIEAKDFMAVDLKDFCDNNDMVFERKGLSMTIANRKATIKIKCYNSLNKYKREKLDEFNSGQMKFNFETELPVQRLELELGYQTTVNRKELKTLQVVDFENESSDVLYKYNQINKETKKAVESKVTTKVNNIRVKDEHISNVIRLKANDE